MISARLVPARLVAARLVSAVLEQRDRLRHKGFGADAGYEDAGVDFDPQAMECGPADYVFDRQACDALLDHASQFNLVGSAGDQHFRLVFREHAAGCAQGRDDPVRQRRSLR
ncbi:hypothetical protein [Kribbella monticola]|uniref:hypothetical protein n=1 Tax=Kribbella monticola TaxID=2185285 RepID=UPI0018E54079|nr:hypothetical protein [Kribbella monticola]